MDSVMAFLSAHQVLATVVIGYVWSSFISALPAPTAESSAFYVFCFKFLNVLAANIARAKGPQVENSPNFQAAVNIQTTQAGVAPITVQPVSKS
jgi:hypothetical protein